MSEERAAILAEELEVLEAIYTEEELEKVSDEVLRIRVEPEDEVRDENEDPIVLSLQVTYTEDYPESAPEMEVSCTSGELPEDGLREMEDELKGIAEESLGMAMVFTLASHLREALTNYLRRVEEAEAAEEQRKRDAEIEAEAEKFRGTAVTAERFAAWRIKFEAEQAKLALIAEEERIKATYKTPKEREQYKALQARPTGKELFAKGGLHADSKASGPVEGDEAEEEGEAVDFSLYSKETRELERREEEERREAELRQRFEALGEE